MKNFVNVFIKLCLFSLCVFHHLHAISTDFVKIQNKIEEDVANKMTKKYDMFWIGEGSKSATSLSWVQLTFEIRTPLSREQARTIIVDCVEELLHGFNSNKLIRPYLQDYPFTPKNIAIQLFIMQKNGAELFDPNISVVSVTRNDEIVFKTLDPHNKYIYKQQYAENYFEALKAVNQRKEAGFSPIDKR